MHCASNARIYTRPVFSSANTKVHSRELATREIPLGAPLAPFIKSYDRARHLLARPRCATPRASLRCLNDAKLIYELSKFQSFNPFDKLQIYANLANRIPSKLSDFPRKGNVNSISRIRSFLPGSRTIRSSSFGRGSNPTAPVTQPSGTILAGLTGQPGSNLIYV